MLAELVRQLIVLLVDEESPESQEVCTKERFCAAKYLLVPADRQHPVQWASCVASLAREYLGRFSLSFEKHLLVQTVKRAKASASRFVKSCERSLFYE